MVRMQVPSVDSMRVGKDLLFYIPLSTKHRVTLKPGDQVIATKLKPGIDTNADLEPEAWDWVLGEYGSLPAGFNVVGKVQFTGRVCDLSIEGLPDDDAHLFAGQLQEVQR